MEPESLPQGLAYPSSQSQSQPLMQQPKTNVSQSQAPLCHPVGNFMQQDPGSPLVPLDPSRFREMVVEKQQVTSSSVGFQHLNQPINSPTQIQQQPRISTPHQQQPQRFWAPSAGSNDPYNPGTPRAPLTPGSVPQSRLPVQSPASMSDQEAAMYQQQPTPSPHHSQHGRSPLGSPVGPGSASPFARPSSQTSPAVSQHAVYSQQHIAYQQSLQQQQQQHQMQQHYAHMQAQQQQQQSQYAHQMVPQQHQQHPGWPHSPQLSPTYGVAAGGPRQMMPPPQPRMMVRGPYAPQYVHPRGYPPPQRLLSPPQQQMIIHRSGYPAQYQTVSPQGYVQQQGAYYPQSYGVRAYPPQRMAQYPPQQGYVQYPPQQQPAFSPGGQGQYAMRPVQRYTHPMHSPNQGYTIHDPNASTGYPQAQEYRPSHFQFYGHDPNLTGVPQEMCLLGCVFLIVDYERLLDQKEVQDWKTVVMMHGGEVENLYTERCTHVICESLRHPVVQQALREGKRCVTAQWLNDCLAQKRMTFPWKAVHFPSSYSDSKPCKNKIFSVSGFDENERYCLMQMISAVGGKFNCYLSQHTDFLISKSLNGLKVEKAQEFKVPVLNVLWLTELFLGFHSATQNLGLPKYHDFNIQGDPFRMDPAYFVDQVPVVMNMMNPWRVPVALTQEIWQTATERKERSENDEAKNFPYKKLKMSPAPEEEEIQTRRNDMEHVNRDPASIPKVAFSGLYPAEIDNLRRKVLWLGGEMVENAVDASHVVSSDLKRTKKLLEAISLGRFIVQPLWVRQSFKQGRFLDPIDFIVKDEGNEKFFGFNLKLSICQARQKKLFEGVLFYLTPSVIPGPSTLRDIVKTAGGEVLSQRPLAKEIASFYEMGKPFFIVTCETDLHLCQSLIDCGVVVQSVEFILTGILRQEVDPVPFRIENRQINQDPIK